MLHRCSKNIDDLNVPRFLQHRRILPKFSLWLLMVDLFLMLSLYVVHLKNLCKTFVNILYFQLEKKVV